MGPGRPAEQDYFHTFYSCLRFSSHSWVTRRCGLLGSRDGSSLASGRRYWMHTRYSRIINSDTHDASLSSWWWQWIRQHERHELNTYLEIVLTSTCTGMCDWSRWISGLWDSMATPRIRTQRARNRAFRYCTPASSWFAGLIIFCTFDSVSPKYSPDLESRIWYLITSAILHVFLALCPGCNRLALGRLVWKFTQTSTSQSGAIAKMMRWWAGKKCPRWRWKRDVSIFKGNLHHRCLWTQEHTPHNIQHSLHAAGFMLCQSEVGSERLWR